MGGGMEWFKIAVQLVGSLIWPAVVLAVVMIFRKELRNVLGSVKEVKYPGGSITVEVARLEERIGKNATLTELVASSALSTEFPPSATDPQLAIAQLRTDIERELVQLSRHVPNNDRSERWDLEHRIDELRAANVLTADFVKTLRDFIKLANNLIHGVEVTPEVRGRLTTVGAAVAAQLHYQRKVLEVTREFEGHLLWHAHRHRDRDNKFYFWSAVAASLPEFDYSYEIYQEATERHKQKLIKWGHDRDAEAFYVLQLSEFVKVLEFRDKELLRLIDTWHHHEGDAWDAFRKANDWQWPSNWGDLGWGGPIIRDQLSVYTAEDDLVRTRNALNLYRIKLLKGESRP